MRSILTVGTAATVTRLATLDRVKLELDITGTSKDEILGAKLDEASADIEALLGFVVARETVTETFWFEATDVAPEYLTLDRTPVASIASVTVDGVATTYYRLDDVAGQLYALDSNGYPCRWYFCKSIVVEYTGGYLLPGQSGRNLPVGIEGATIELMTDYWSAKGRDPSLKSEEIPGVISQSYWVGTVGDAGELPPRVQMKIAPYRRAIA